MTTLFRKSTTLSKSRIMTGIQCPKALYLQIHAPDLVSPVTALQQAIFNQGHEVGLAAQAAFPGGATIEARSLEDAMAETSKAISEEKNTFYEAAFQHDEVIIKSDILRKDPGSSKWDLIEVKSSTSVKEEHILDVAIQAHVLNESGIEIASHTLMHLNNECVWPDKDQLFTLKNISDHVAEAMVKVPSRVAKLKDIVSQSAPPDVTIGPQCSKPYDFAFVDHCWKAVPSPSVFELPGFHRKIWGYFAQGVVRIDDPKMEPFIGTRKHQVNAILTGTRWVDKNVITRHLSEWQWPLHFLDFETIGYAIPRIHGTRPFQQIPFQFSCHTLQSIDAEPEHSHYLHTDSSDPRPGFLAAFLRSIKPVGSIVSYNKIFEARCLMDLADASPDHSTAIQSIIDRLVDTLPIFREGVYDAKFCGSFSLKSMAPAILGKDAGYSDLEVGDGASAQQAFMLQISPDISVEKSRRTREALLEYCKKDTGEMLKLVEWFFEQEHDAPNGEV